MEVIVSNNNYIITPLTPKLDERETQRLKEEICAARELPVGIDLSFVKECSVDFIDTVINTKNISLFNIPSDIFALLTIMNVDKNINLYVSKLDFLAGKRRIVKRNFTLLAD